MKSISDEILDRHASLPVLANEQIRWLRDQGVPASALHRPDVIVRAPVVYRADRFVFSDEATPDELTAVTAVILLYDRDGAPTDIAAWQPRTGRVAPWLGRVSYLGDPYGPRLDLEGVILVHPSPLEWLASARNGIALVDDDLAREQLRDIGPFAVECGPGFGQALRQILTPRAPEILVFVKDAA